MMASATMIAVKAPAMAIDHWPHAGLRVPAQNLEPQFARARFLNMMALARSAPARGSRPGPMCKSYHRRQCLGNARIPPMALAARRDMI
jgi:hypothetical protein